MFLAYSNLDVVQARHDRRKKAQRTEQRSDYKNTKQQRRYVAGRRPDWEEEGLSDEDDLGARYLKATSNDVARRPKHRDRPKYVPPVPEVVPRNQRHIRMPKVIEHKHEAPSSDSDQSPGEGRRRRGGRSIAKPELVAEADDRLARLEQFNRRKADESKEDGHAGRMRRRHRHVENSSSDDDGNANDSDLDENDMIRRRARLLAQRDAKKEIVRLNRYDRDDAYTDDKPESTPRQSSRRGRQSSDEEESEEMLRESESSESSSSEASSESSEEDIMPKIAPIFMTKEKRVTLDNEEDVKQRKEEQEKRTKQEAEERRAYTLSIVETEIQRERDEQDFKDTKISLNDIAKQMAAINTDDSDDERAFASWKKREFGRLKREKEARDEEIAAEEDRARRQEMHESELVAQAHERKNLADEQRGEKKRHNFLQRYYHKGTFFQDNEQLVEMVAERAAAPTLEDKFDRSVLPEVMQTKYFGKRSQVKHTHLAKEDTSRKDAWGLGGSDDRQKRPQKPR